MNMFSDQKLETGEVLSVQQMNYVLYQQQIVALNEYVQQDTYVLGAPIPDDVFLNVFNTDEWVPFGFMNTPPVAPEDMYIMEREERRVCDILTRGSFPVVNQWGEELRGTWYCGFVKKMVEFVDAPSFCLAEPTSTTPWDGKVPLDFKFCPQWVPVIFNNPCMPFRLRNSDKPGIPFGPKVTVAHCVNNPDFVDMTRYPTQTHEFPLLGRDSTQLPQTLVDLNFDVNYGRKGPA